MEKGDSEFVRIGCMVFEVALNKRFLDITKIKGKFDGGGIETREEALLYAKRVRRLANLISDAAKKLPTEAMREKAAEEKHKRGLFGGEAITATPTEWPDASDRARL